MKRSFTKPPWTIQWPGYDGKQFKIYKVYDTGAKMLIASLPQREGCMCMEDRGNVLLTKYAPEMYELLEELFDVFNLCTRQAIARWVKNGCSIRLARECAAKNIEYARKIKKLLKEVKGETNEKD